MALFEGAQNTHIYGGNFSTISSRTIGPDKLDKALKYLQHRTAFAAFHNSKARYPPPKCLPRTREAVLQQITQWIKVGHAEQPILWLYGPAGAGKSAIAQTITEISEEIGYHLAASFFFLRTSGECSDAERLVPSIAYQLMSSLPATRPFILGAIAAIGQIFHLNIEAQIQELIVKPLHLAKVTRSTNEPSKVVIVDGLDECDSPEKRSEFLKAFIKVCSGRNFPLIFLFASRPERDIRDVFNATSSYRLSGRLVLDNTFDPDNDIDFFLRHHFTELKATHPLKAYIPADWPPSSVLEALVTKSSGQFIYASTVIKYVASKKHRPTQRLQIIMATGSENADTSPFQELDALYTLVLSAAEDTPRLLRVIGMVLCALETTVTPAYIEQTLGLEIGEVLLLLDDLHSLIEVGGPNDPLRPFHASFNDFLIDRARAGTYYLDVGEAHANLTIGTLQVLFDKPDCQDYPTESRRFDTHFSLASPTEPLCQYLLGFQWVRVFNNRQGRAFEDPDSHWLKCIPRLFRLCRRASQLSPAWSAVYDRLLVAFGKQYLKVLVGTEGGAFSQDEMWMRRLYLKYYFAVENLDIFPQVTGGDWQLYRSFELTIYDALRHKEASGIFHIDLERHNHIMAEEIEHRIFYNEYKVALQQMEISKTRNSPTSQPISDPTWADGGAQTSCNEPQKKVGERLAADNSIHYRIFSRLDIIGLLKAVDHRNPYIDGLLPRLEDQLITGLMGEEGVEELKGVLSSYKEKPLLPSIPAKERDPSDTSMHGPFYISDSLERDFQLSQMNTRSEDRQVEMEDGEPG